MMDTTELKSRLDFIRVSPNQYSLDGELNSDKIILHRNYSGWEVFYLDERGLRNDERKFDSEDAACKYIFKLFEDAKNIELIFNVNA